VKLPTVSNRIFVNQFCGMRWESDENHFGCGGGIKELPQRKLYEFAVKVQLEFENES
jgi:hypothetical protein